uniref:lipoyl(octanoyl) transferase n=1 Tax=Haemonchus contortus TaxID=6289 RepID=A0A7I4YJQ0_HAECO
MLRVASLVAFRRYSSEAGKGNLKKIVVCRNGSVAAWHPETPFPYEHSRPVVLEEEDKAESPLSNAVNRASRWKEGPNVPQLKDIFYTSKHEWYTRTREERLRSYIMRLSSLLSRCFKLVNLGKLSYAKGLEEQHKFLDLAKKAKEKEETLNFILAVEHTPVYTVGIRSKLYTEDEEVRLKALGADFYRTSRGGLITFHGPGQLVMYPVFNLKRIAPRPIGVKRYVEMLEQVIINCATEDFCISKVGRTQHTGVWVGENRKLAALGIAVSHGVSYHGIALNCNTDLSWYDHVVGCGIEGAEATSLSRECCRDISIDETLPKMVKQFASVFNCDVA